MAFTTNNTELFNSGDISFSELRNRFGGNASNVKFSTYRRNTDTGNINESKSESIVPDAVENENISTSDNLNLESFRGSIAEYVVEQTGEDTNIEAASADFNTTYWNNNLNKNIIKKLNVKGAIYSDIPEEPALTVEGEFLNLQIEVFDDYGIFGAGGVVGGSGGTALYVDNTRSDEVDIRPNEQLTIKLNSNASIYGGGGGGEKGERGKDGKLVTCTSSSTTNTSVSGSTESGGSPTCVAPNCPSGYSSNGCRPTGGNRQRCRGGGRRSSETGYVCSSTWTRNCSKTTYSSYNIQASGGAAGAGGNGQGYGKEPEAGTSGKSGSKQCCPNGSCSEGSDGLAGTAGFSFGGGGEKAGKAIIASLTGDDRIPYKIVGKSINNIKGPIKNEA